MNAIPPSLLSVPLTETKRIGSERNSPEEPSGNGVPVGDGSVVEIGAETANEPPVATAVVGAALISSQRRVHFLHWMSHSSVRPSPVSTAACTIARTRLLRYPSSGTASAADSASGTSARLSTAYFGEAPGGTSNGRPRR